MVIPGCKEPTVEAPPAPPPPKPEPVKPQPEIPADQLDKMLASIEEGEPKWLRVSKLREGAEGGWATGHFIAEDNKLVIETDGVDEFVVTLDRIDIDWTRRVVLRIDGDNFELSRKNYPTLRLNRTPGGSWIPVKPDDDPQ